MRNKNLQSQTQEDQAPHPKFLPFMFESESDLLKLEEAEKEKVEEFEEKLVGEIHASDTIDAAIKKMVKSALAVEFGELLVKDKAAADMINTITTSILADPQLRRQALIIVDRYTGKQRTKTTVKDVKPAAPEVELY